MKKIKYQKSLTVFIPFFLFFYYFQMKIGWGEASRPYRRGFPDMNCHLLIVPLYPTLTGGAFGALAGQCQEMQTKEKIVLTFSRKVPKEWGERVKGVKTRLNTDQKAMALTFDACGGPKGSAFDAKLINFLENEKIPATLFISGRWIDANPEICRVLSKNPFFEIENHGLSHKPCSVNGRSVYGIEGTRDVSEVVDEIEQNALKIQALTGQKPKYYRPATAYCDEICVEVAIALGYELVNFSVLGDAGATYTKGQVKEALLNARPSSIILLHMNHPEGETAEGLIDALPELKKRGFKFVKLSEYNLQ